MAGAALIVSCYPIAGSFPAFVALASVEMLFARGVRAV